jgi:hypothetical protein
MSEATDAAVSPAAERPAYDAFFSYGPSDLDWVEGFLLAGLVLPDDRVLTPDRFTPGVPMAQEVERAVRSSANVVVVLSTAYLADDWSVFAEDLATHLAVEAGTTRIVVVRHEACDVPAALSGRQVVDATDPTQWDAALEELRHVIGGPPPAPEEITCPYPGMVPYDASSAERFYGREEETTALVTQVQGSPFAMVIGPSGSGKSSLLQAGLLPRLQQQGGWVMATMRPVDAPADHLAAAMAAFGPAPGFALPDGARRGLLVVDQLEEAFTLAPPAQRSAFFEALQVLRPVPHLSVLLLMRADFYPELMASPLWPLHEGERVELAPLQGKALRRAVVRPAESVAVHVEPDLVERLLADARDEPGALPLLQETMRHLWKRRRRRLLTLDVYEAMGGPNRTGLAVALAEKAEEAYDDLTAPQRDIARRVFVGLVQLGEGRDDTRRQQSVDDLRAVSDDPTIFDATVAHLAGDRLLVLGGDEHSHVVDLSHEALISGWPRLRDWLTQDRRALEVQRDLTEDADKWVAGGRDAGDLYRTARLAVADDWAESHAGDLARDEAEFLRASHDVANAEQRRLKRTNRRLRFLAVGMALAMVATVGAAAWARHKSQEAEREARRAAALGLEGTALALPDGDLDTALLSSLTAGALLNKSADDPAAFASARTLLARHPGLERIVRPDAETSAAIVSYRGLEVTDESGTPVVRASARCGADRADLCGDDLELSAQIRGLTGDEEVDPASLAVATTDAATGSTGDVSGTGAPLVPNADQPPATGTSLTFTDPADSTRHPITLPGDAILVTADSPDGSLAAALTTAGADGRLTVVLVTGAPRDPTIAWTWPVASGAGAPLLLSLDDSGHVVLAQQLPRRRSLVRLLDGTAEATASLRGIALRHVGGATTDLVATDEETDLLDRDTAFTRAKRPSGGAFVAQPSLPGSSPTLVAQLGATPVVWDLDARSASPPLGVGAQAAAWGGPGCGTGQACRLAVVGDGVAVWRPDREVQMLDEETNAFLVAWVPGTARLVTAGWGPTVTFWDTDVGGQPTAGDKLTDGGALDVTAGDLLLTAVDGGVEVVAADGTGTRLDTGDVGAGRLAPDGQHALVARGDAMDLYDVPSGQQVPLDASCAGNTATFDDSSSLVAAVGDNGSERPDSVVFVCDAGSGELVGYAAVDDQLAPISSAAVSTATGDVTIVAAGFTGAIGVYVLPPGDGVVPAELVGALDSRLGEQDSERTNVALHGLQVAALTVPLGGGPVQVTLWDPTGGEAQSFPLTEERGGPIAFLDGDVVAVAVGNPTADAAITRERFQDVLDDLAALGIDLRATDADHLAAAISALPADQRDRVFDYLLAQPDLAEVAGQTAGDLRIYRYSVASRTRLGTPLAGLEGFPTGIVQTSDGIEAVDSVSGALWHWSFDTAGRTIVDRVCAITGRRLDKADLRSDDATALKGIPLPAVCPG